MIMGKEDNIVKKIERKIRRAISKFHMYTPIDHIMLCAYPLPEGIVLAEYLARIEREFPRSKLTILVPEMISFNVKEHQQNIRITRISEEVFSRVAKIAEEANKYNVPRGNLSLAALLNELQRLAREIEANKIALPLTADIEAYLAFEKVIYGHMPLLDMPLKVKINALARITLPMINVSNEDVRKFLSIKGDIYEELELPIEEDIVQWINKLEERSPGIIYGYLSNVERIMELKSEEIVICESCGRPSLDKLCNECRVIKLISPT